MTHIEQSISGYSTRMKATFYFAIAPLNLLLSLLSVNGKGLHGDVVRGISIFFGVISSPVLLLATPVTITMGLIAGIAQTALLPFQLFFSAINDFMAPSKPAGSKKTEPSVYDEPSYDDSSNDYNAAEKRADKHFDPLFTQNSTSTEALNLELTPEDNSYTPR